MGGKTIKYFASGHTAQGFYSLFNDVFAELAVLIILKGSSEREQSNIIEKVATKLQRERVSLEKIYCPTDANLLAGLIIRSLNIGIINEANFQQLNNYNSKIKEIEVGAVIRDQYLTEQIEEVEALSNSFTKKAYNSFAKALQIHYRLEKIFINNMDFAKADQVAAELINDIFTIKKSPGQSTIKRRFLGATTPQGSVHFIDNLTADLNKRYFIKGRAGTGKSTLQRRLIDEANLRGLDMEIYFCGFDPTSIDMVIFRQLGIAIFDSTPPHELFPSREGDLVVDMYEKTVDKTTDEKFHREITEVTSLYRKKIEKGLNYLVQAKQHHDELQILLEKGTEKQPTEVVVKNIINNIIK